MRRMETLKNKTKQKPRRWRSAAFGTEYRVRGEEGFGLGVEDNYYLAVRRRRIKIRRESMEALEESV